MGTHWADNDPIQLEVRGKRLQTEAHKDVACSPKMDAFQHPLLRYGVMLRKYAKRLARQKGLIEYHNHLVNPQGLHRERRREELVVVGESESVQPEADETTPYGGMEIGKKRGQSGIPLKW